MQPGDIGYSIHQSEQRREDEWFEAVKSPWYVRWQIIGSILGLCGWVGVFFKYRTIISSDAIVLALVATLPFLGALVSAWAIVGRLESIPYTRETRQTLILLRRMLIVMSLQMYGWFYAARAIGSVLRQLKKLTPAG